MRNMKTVIKTVLAPPAALLKPPISFLCFITRNINYYMYKLAFILNWKLGRSPSWFDHNIDIFYLWDKEGETGWFERGFLSQFAIQWFDAPNVLELGCADGFYSKKFYLNALNSSRKRCLKAIESIAWSADDGDMQIRGWGGGAFRNSKHHWLRYQ